MDGPGMKLVETSAMEWLDSAKKHLKKYKENPENNFGYLAFALNQAELAHEKANGSGKVSEEAESVKEEIYALAKDYRN